MTKRNTILSKATLLFFCMLFSHSLMAQFKVVGYLYNWGNFLSEAQNVDYTKVTHVNIAFFNPNSSGDLAIGNNLDTVVKIIHANHAFALASLGGATATTNVWSPLTKKTKRTNFVSKLLAFTQTHNLDGLDVDLEGILIDANYNGFVQELCDSLHAHGKLVTTALQTSLGDKVTDLTLAKYDLVNVMSYDYYGTWSGPGQHSPYSAAENELGYWINTRHIPKEKVILGVPSYGYSWKGTTKKILPYTTIVNDYPKAAYQDSINAADGAVIYYNGVETIKQKTALAYSTAGGIMMWTLQYDLPSTSPNSLIKAITDHTQLLLTNKAPSVNITYPLVDTLLSEGDSLLISATATDLDGTIQKVEFYQDNNLIGTTMTPPYQLYFKNIEGSRLNIYAKVMDNTYLKSISDSILLNIRPTLVRKPYGGKPWAVPGKIEAEHFDYGTNLGYSDTDEINNGILLTENNISFRNGPVDIQSCTDSLLGFDIGWNESNEWLKYSIKVDKDSIYKLQARVASIYTGSKFHIEKNDTNITGSIIVPNTGDWQNWVTVTIDNLKFTANDTVLKLVYESGYLTLNYFSFKLSTNLSTEINDPFYTNTDELILFPNPCGHELNLQYESKNRAQTSIQIFDAQGKIVFEKKELKNTGLQIEKINTDSYTSGIYLLIVNGKAQKFIVQ